jgi:hypothetical protein
VRARGHGTAHGAAGGAGDRHHVRDTPTYPRSAR